MAVATRTIAATACLGVGVEMILGWVDTGSLMVSYSA